MSTIATVDDVKRVLRKMDDADIDVYLRPKLDEAEDYIKRTLGINYGETGTVTVSYPDIRNDSILELPDDNPTIVSITADGTALDTTQYELYANGLLYFQLPFYAFDNIGAVVRNTAYIWRKVTVVFTPSGAVTRLLREAAAKLAAALYQQEEMGVAPIQSETLGDYTYSLDTSFDGVPPEVVKALSAMKRVRVRTT